jgi:hypothetical protein
MELTDGVKLACNQPCPARLIVGFVFKAVHQRLLEYEFIQT